MKPFDLRDDYLAHGIILILIPWSIFFFLIIVFVKVIFFFFAESKKRTLNNNRTTGRSNYGQFNDDELDAETESVISVYFNIMERVKYNATR